MSPSVARGALNLRILKIDDCQSMEEVITKEEEQGEGIFLTNDALELPFLREVLIDDFPEMKTFVQQGISVSTPSLKWVNYDDKVKVDDLNKWTQQRFTSQKSEASLISAPRSKKLVKALPMVRCLTPENCKRMRSWQL